MKIKKYFIALNILILVFLNGCEYKKSAVNTDWGISDVSFLEIDGDKGYIYNIEDDYIYKVKEDSKILNYAYKSKGIFLKSILLEQNQKLTNNYLKIEDKNRVYELKDYYCYTDIRLSPNGDKISARIYKNDDLFSAIGLTFFNSMGNKIDFNPVVSVSGNVFNFLDDNNILYYGPSEDEKSKYGTIYNYDFIKNVNTTYFNNLNGYLMKFSIDKSGFMFLNERVGFYDYISYFDPIKSKKVESNKAYDGIYSIETLGDGKFIFSANDLNKEYIDLYEVDCKSDAIHKIVDSENSKLTLINNLVYIDNKVYFVAKRENSLSNYIFELNLTDMKLSNIYKSNNILILNKSSNK